MRSSSGVENAGIWKQSPLPANLQQQPTSAQTRASSTGRHGMKVTYFQNTFSKYQLRPYTLRFRNKELEKEYEEELMRDSKSFYTFAVSCICCMSIVAALDLAFLQDSDKTWMAIVMGLSSILHIAVLVMIRNEFAQLKQLIFCLSIVNIVVYSNFLSLIGDQFSVGQLIFLEDIFVYSIIIFLRTHTFTWDSTTIIASRLILFIFLLITSNEENQFKDYFLLLLFCVISGVLIVFNLFKNEKLRRVAFLNGKQREQWNLIVDEVLPINVIISKYDAITGEMGLNASNQEAQSHFKVTDDQSFNAFMQKIRLETPNSKRTLRDFILEKHHAIALESQKRHEHNIKPLATAAAAATGTNGNRQKINSDVKSLADFDSPVLDDLDSKYERNPSIKKVLTQRSIIRKRRLTVENNGHQKFFEILKGYYCEDWEKNPNSRCQYKIQVFQFSMNEPLLLINVEDSSDQERIKALKANKKQYQELFKDTLRFFQDRIVRLSTEIGQLAIPISQSNIYYDLKFSVMSIFTGIHNILDFVFEQNSTDKTLAIAGAGAAIAAAVTTPIGQGQAAVVISSGANSHQQQGSANTQKKELSPQRQRKKDSFFLQNSPQISIEEDLYMSIEMNLNTKINPPRQQQQQQQPQQQQIGSSNGAGGESALGNTKIRQFSLRKVLNEVADVMFEKCRQKKIMFFFSDLLSEEYQMVQDQRRVKQILFNYLQNAYESVNKGYIALTVRPYSNLGLKTFRFDIMDSGPGLSDAIIMGQNDDGFGGLNGISGAGNGGGHHHTHVQVVSLRKKSTKQYRKLSSFSNYFQHITTANPTSKKKGLGIGMKVNHKVIARLGPYFPKVTSETDIGTHIVYELYSDIMAIRSTHNKHRFVQPFDHRQQEDIPEEDECIGLSCYKYTRQEIYHFTKNSKVSNLLHSPDSAIFCVPQPQQQPQHMPSSQNYLVNPFGSISNLVPSVIQSMLNTPIIIPSNVSTITADMNNNNMFNQSFPLRTPSSLLQYEAPSRHRPESLDNALGVGVKGTGTRSNPFVLSTNTQQGGGGQGANNNNNNNSFTVESFRSKDRSRNDSFFIDMNNRKRLLNQQLPNQLLLNLNGSDDGNMQYSNNPYFQNGSLPNYNYNTAGHFQPYKKYSLHDLSNYS